MARLAPVDGRVAEGDDIVSGKQVSIVIVGASFFFLWTGVITPPTAIEELAGPPYRDFPPQGP
jgi:hypothetical protein